MSGVVLPYWLDRPADEAFSVAREADRLGFDELWIGELYHFDAFALAAGLLSTVRTITPVIGPVAAAVRDPVTIARGVATVAEIAGREVRLALGASTPAVVERFHGREFGSEPERMRGTVAAIRSQLSTGRSPSGYRSALPTLQPHLTVAAFGPRMTAVARETADRMVVNLVSPRQAQALAAAAEIPTTVWVVAALDPTAATRGQIAAQVAHYLAAPGYSSMFEDAGFGDVVGKARDGMPMGELAHIVPEALIATVALYGGPADLEAGWNAYVRAGVDVAIVPATTHDPAGTSVLTFFAERR